MIKRAYYYGYVSGGHFLYEPGPLAIYHEEVTPWDLQLMDTGLLKNGKHADIVDGRVFWTCAKGPWLAFVWWDRSGDKRPNSNSGFYVQGFEHTERKDAWEFACSQFPAIIKRQSCPLVLQEK